MAVILTKKKDTTGAPAAGDLTNSSGGAELAVNTADKRLYTKDSGANIVEVGTNPGTAVTFTAGTASLPSITTTGDVNTGVFFPSADTVGVATGGSERLRVDSSGNVGIGTSSPSNYAGYKTLTINGTSGGEIDFMANGALVGDIYNGSDYLTIYGSSSLRFSTNGSERMRIDSSGNVLVGTTTTPSGGGVVEVLARSSGSFLQLTQTATNIGGAAIGTNIGTGLLFYTHTGAVGSETYTERMRIDSSGNVGIGTTSPSTLLDVDGAITAKGGNGPTYGFKLKTVAGTATPRITNNNDDGTVIRPGASAAYVAFANYANSAELVRITDSGNVGIGTASPGSILELKAATPILTINGTTQNSARGIAFQDNGTTRGSLTHNSDSGATTLSSGDAGNGYFLAFRTDNAERARITSGGQFLVGKTSDNDSKGFRAGPDYTYCVSDNTVTLYINRLTSDGTLIQFSQGTVDEGSISVSGNTVSYNAFAGSHWSQLQEGRGYNPDIPRGTVMSTIGEMCEWKSVKWDEVIEHPAIEAVEAVEGKEAVLDEEGNVIEPAVEAVAGVEGKDAWTETIPHREEYLGQLPFGATFEEDGVTKTVVDDGNERLPKVKISDVVGDKAVYGVFQTYDEVQDMLVTSLGAFVVRIASGVTVQIGDLLESNGDGCAKVQDDDVIRSKTIAKVTSTTPTATYADGSYTVPCVLYCG